MATRTLLVIEDDAAIRHGVVMAVRSGGYAAIECSDGHKAKVMITQATCDLVLLDLVLPGATGLELLTQIRKERPTLPVIILTALGDERDRVRGLELGADDYVVKPFSVKELLARVEAVLRRSPERAAPVAELSIPGGCADFNRRELRFSDGKRSELSEREAELLAYLAANPGRAISREEILTRVWRLDPKGLSTRAIDMQVARLREKLRDDSDTPAVLLTVRGTGYMLAARSA
jgi:two-component system alkaline phosphatase synthesis response regulator PhoP